MALRLLAASALLCLPATSLDPGGLYTPPTPPLPPINLLSALGVHNATWEGVKIVSGYQQRPAYYFQGDSRDIRLSPASFQNVADLLRNSPEFTLSAWLRQERGNIGSIVSVTFENFRYLELQSSGRKNEIRLHYTSHQQIFTETFSYELADNAWHHVALSLSGSEAELFVDCHRLYKRLLKPGPPDRVFSPQHQFWIGQRNKHFFFKGAMQDLLLVSGLHGYRHSCPELDSGCPTCGQFGQLQTAVEELGRHMEDLSERLRAAEARVLRLEDCDCQKSCRFNDTLYADGATWQRDCELCACVHGEVKCRPVECPVLPCKNPVNVTGECCQSCLNACLMHGVFYEHGDIVNIKQCIECKCHDGSMQCKRIDPEMSCPKLTCPPENQFSVAGECCKYCPGVDYCSKGHMCHANATCLNLQTTYTCHCDQGFQGDGHTCSDRDECQQEGGLEGHHCHLNARCVNTVGSYRCECLPGYRQVDKYNCQEMDECSTGEHNCHAQAQCINTMGSYHCVCSPGYSGDGYNCEPVCKPGCLNGGVCRSPGICGCPAGFTGPSCERDLDECTTNAHRCSDSSICVNMIGWYYCECRPGFRSVLLDNNLGRHCEDIDECSMGQHTCHPQARCVNTFGSYQCECTENAQNCRLSCQLNGMEVLDGTTVTPPGRPCERCTCERGALNCSNLECDCNVVGSEDACCPQCDLRLSCAHQELSHVVLQHGERWLYQCQTCECLRGQVDCWDLHCPPLPCATPKRNPRDCCPHCEDPCEEGALITSGGMGGCPYAAVGIQYESGARFAPPDDPCASCECKVPYCSELDGVLCCSYNLNCGNNNTTNAINGITSSSNNNNNKHQQQQHQQENQHQHQQNLSQREQQEREGENGEEGEDEERRNASRSREETPGGPGG